MAFQQLSKEIITAGDGKNYPKQGDTLTMHYTGTLASNGSCFDSSVNKGRPFSFRIGTLSTLQLLARACANQLLT